MEDLIIEVRHLNDVVYCPRRFVLKHVVGMRAVNLAMAIGLAEHQGTERRGGELIVYSESLGLIGRVDSLRKVSGMLVLSEHKMSLGTGRHDQIQIQALEFCLAEMGVRVDRLELHDRKSHRTVVVEHDHQEVRRVVGQARLLLAASELPVRLTDARRCKACVVREACGR